MKALALTAGLLVLVPLVGFAGGGAAVSELVEAGSARTAAPWGDDVPPEFDELYAGASERFGVPVGVLRAVGKVECDHNRPTERIDPADPSSPLRSRCDRPNEAGAQGPMQFLPATFERWSWASGSTAPSVVDPTDAVYAAAAKLGADGVAADPVTALWAYNHSYLYVAEVLAWAVVYGWRPAAGVLAFAVEHHPDLALRPADVSDVRAGRVDERVLATLLALATRHRLGGVGPFTRHNTYVAGTSRASNHVFGRAVDVGAVDGKRVSADNENGRALVLDALTLPHDIRPTEVLSPWELAVGGARSLTDDDHGDHVHLGFDE